MALILSNRSSASDFKYLPKYLSSRSWFLIFPTTTALQNSKPRLSVKAKICSRRACTVAVNIGELTIA
jgi:hypothetical protein